MARSDKPTLSHRSEYIATLALSNLLGHLPPALALNLGAFFGAMAGRIAPVRRSVVLENLQIAFGGDISSGERSRLAREAYTSLGLLGAQSLCLRVWDRPTTQARVVEVEGQEHVDLLRSTGWPPIAVTAHFGDWELLGAAMSQRYPVTVVSKPLHNPLLQRDVERWRRKDGLEILWTDEDSLPRRIISAVKNQRVVTFFPDQDMRTHGVFVPFFHQQASTTPAPAVFALRLGRPLLPAYLVRLGPTRHRLVFRPPIWPAEAQGATRDEQVLDLTRRHVAVLEDMIRLYPAQYFWFHRRWKTTPEAAEKRQATIRKRRKIAEED
ncbi:MAG: lysophospholipid acyltransferase family protein [Sumerlaeia bacterium]